MQHLGVISEGRAILNLTAHRSQDDGNSCWRPLWGFVLRQSTIDPTLTVARRGVAGPSKLIQECTEVIETGDVVLIRRLFPFHRKSGRIVTLAKLPHFISTTSSSAAVAGWQAYEQAEK